MFNSRVMNAIPEELKPLTLPHPSVPSESSVTISSPPLPLAHPSASNGDPDPAQNSAPSAVLFGTWRRLRGLPVTAGLELRVILCDL